MPDEPSQVLAVTVHSAVGQKHDVALQGELGPCAANLGGGLVWAEHRTPTTVSRLFAVPPALEALLGSSCVELAIHVTARIESRHPSSVTFAGPGAAFHAIMRTNPALRQSQNPFPDLPYAWVDAIGRAARGERLLVSSPEVAVIGVAVARASAAGVTAPKPVAAAVTPAVRTATASSFAAGEIIRESDIIRSERVPGGHRVVVRDRGAVTVQIRNGRWVVV